MNVGWWDLKGLQWAPVKDGGAVGMLMKSRRTLVALVVGSSAILLDWLLGTYRWLGKDFLLENKMAYG